MFISNNATVTQMAAHFFYMIPTIVSQTTPAVILLATLMTFGAMSKHNEIVAVKANGVSLYRLSLPLVFICLAVSVVLFFFSELITPRSFHRAEYIRLVEVQKQEALGIFKQNEIWYRGSNTIYNVRMFDVNNNSLHGITIHYLEDFKAQIGLADKLWLMGWALHFPRAFELPASPEDAAVVLFTSGSEGKPKGVVLPHRAILANIAQIRSVIDFSVYDKVLNALPIFHSFGLTAGALLPVLNGASLFLYPSPLHYRVIPELAYDRGCTILFGTSTFLANYGKFANPYDF